jgi:hypothetical protein
MDEEEMDTVGVVVVVVVEEEGVYSSAFVCG